MRCIVFLPKVLKFNYDAYGRTVRTTYADGSFTTQTFDKDGRLWKQSTQAVAGTLDTDLVQMVFEYDKYGRLIRVTLPAALDSVSGRMVHPVYEYAYDAFGNQTLIRDPLGHETRFNYDTQGHEMNRTLPLGFGTGGKLSTGETPTGAFTVRGAAALLINTRAVCPPVGQCM